jgi:hypothetical protein
MDAKHVIIHYKRVSCPPFVKKKVFPVKIFLTPVKFGFIFAVRTAEL